MVLLTCYMKGNPHIFRVTLVGDYWEPILPKGTPTHHLAFHPQVYLTATHESTLDQASAAYDAIRSDSTEGLLEALQQRQVPSVCVCVRACVILDVGARELLRQTDHENRNKRIYQGLSSRSTGPLTSLL